MLSLRNQDDGDWSKTWRMPEGVIFFRLMSLFFWHCLAFFIDVEWWGLESSRREQAGFSLCNSQAQSTNSNPLQRKVCQGA